MGDGVDILGERNILPESVALCSLNCRKVASKKIKKRFPARAHICADVGYKCLFMYTFLPLTRGFRIQFCALNNIVGLLCVLGHGYLDTLAEW